MVPGDRIVTADLSDATTTTETRRHISVEREGSSIEMDSYFHDGATAALRDERERT